MCLMQHNSSFKLLAIQLIKFNFEQVGQLKAVEHIALSLTQSISTGFEKDKNIYKVILNLDLKMLQDEHTIYIVESAILSQIEVPDDFDEKFLKNVVAMLYSYLRPMIAQVTVMAKLPPLDIPPINLSGIEVLPIDKQSSK